MSPHHIKAIFFDAAGTLFTVNGSVGEIYARLAREYGKEVEIKDLEAGFRRCFAEAPPMAFPGASSAPILALEKQWWRDIVQKIFAPLGPFPRFSEYFDALFSYFAQTAAWRLYPETLQTLTALHECGVCLGVISNFDSRLFGLLDGFGLSRFFDPIVISTQAGAAKPESAIFTQALARHGFRPAETFHVGDSVHADIAGAQAVGLLPVLIDRHGTAQETEGYRRVTSLAEVITLLHSGE
ncbi:MAG: HAD-IA family hydrolase [Candidatus Binatia bacterium]